jgi:L,D-transpeptidase YcbB
MLAALVLAGALLWVDAHGQTTPEARTALALLADAASDGLDPHDYEEACLETANGSCDPRAFDAALTAAMLRYMRHLHSGRVDPRTIGFRLAVATDEHDFPAMLNKAVGEQRVGSLPAMLRPSFSQYEALRGALAQYRILAAGADTPPIESRSRAVRPGDAFDDLPALHRLLVVLGDLPAGSPAPAAGAPYAGEIVAGVESFQRRHGMASDGVIGAQTFAALRVPLSWRVRQIELALERLRWLPHFSDGRVVAINIPMFRLWVWDAGPPGSSPAFSMNVIVGRALDTRTPVFVEEMTEVIFRPYWNVPRSIVRGEILPKLAADPDYLRRENMELVREPGDDARPRPADAENIAKLREGSLRLRQRPGARNSLGLIKFVFPNDENVYMHGTPAQALFARSRRDFSHGCVRVERPIDLAAWALSDQPEWTRERIESATAGSDSTHVALRRPIQVVLFYITAAVMPEDHRLNFAADIYRHDDRLDAAMRLPAMR